MRELSVYLIANAPRVRDGYISSSTSGHARALTAQREGPICREDVVASAHACPRVPPQNLHGKEGVDGSSPSEGLFAGLKFRPFTPKSLWPEGTPGVPARPGVTKIGEPDDTTTGSSCRAPGARCAPSRGARVSRALRCRIRPRRLIPNSSSGWSCTGIRDTRPPSRKRTCCRAGWCVTSIAGAVDQGSSDSGFELGGVPLHTRG